MSKIYYLVFACGLLMSASSDCTSKFECKAIKTDSGEYSLEVTLIGGTSNEYTFELNDLNTGDQVKKNTVYFGVNDRKAVFEHVKPSTYVVYYSSSDCSTKKAIPGKGIILQ